MQAKLGRKVVVDLIVLLSALFLWGCSPQSVGIVPAGEESQLPASKAVVFEGIVADFVGGEPNWTLSEKFAWGMPLYPKEGWWADLTIVPTCVQKGLVDEKEICLKRVLVRHLWSERAHRVPPYDVLRSRPYLSRNQRVLVGFDSRHSGHYRGLTIAPLQPSGSAPSTQQAPK